MSFKPYEMLILLGAQTKLSRDDIRDKGGPDRRVQQRIINENPLYKVRDETALMNILLEQGVLPWDWRWQHPLARLRELHNRGDLSGIERQLGALYVMAEAIIRNPTLVDRPFYIGALYFAGLYLIPFANPKNSAYAQDKYHAAEKACQWFDQLTFELKSENTPAANLIKANTAANIVAAHWNMRTPDERKSEEMQNIIRKSDYINWAMRQVELFPKLDTPAFNALAIASHLHWRELYPRLHRALVRSGSDFTSYKEYNEDFDDFRNWLNSHNQNVVYLAPEKNEGMNKMRHFRSSAVAALTVIALAIGGVFMSKIEKVKTQSVKMHVVDLRPHVSTNDIG